MIYNFNNKTIKLLNYLLFLTFLAFANTGCFVTPLKQDSKVYLYTNNSQHSSAIKDILHKNNITFEAVDSITPDEQNLYVILDVYNIEQNKLPRNYIVYQSLDLNQNELTHDYLTKLINSIAVWDYSQANINKYRSYVHHHNYLPENHEFADPVVLPCFLPTKTLDTYKDLLIYSNTFDTDISSHLPTIFFYTLMQNPQIIVESGVRGGQSTKAFRKALQFLNAKLIGLDIDPICASSYSNIENATFITLDDLQFTKFYTRSVYRESPIDVVFIDTSHQYEHTLQEINIFAPLLNKDGLIIFHDSNVTPLNNNTGYVRLNGTSGYAEGNTQGVVKAIKEYLSLEFDKDQYLNTTCTKNDTSWHIIHYPFCNGLTILKKVK